MSGRLSRLLFCLIVPALALCGCTGPLVQVNHWYSASNCASNGPALSINEDNRGSAANGNTFTGAALTGIQANGNHVASIEKGAASVAGTADLRK